MKDSFSLPSDPRSHFPRAGFWRFWGETRLKPEPALTIIFIRDEGLEPTLNCEFSSFTCISSSDQTENRLVLVLILSTNVLDIHKLSWLYCFASSLSCYLANGCCLAGSEQLKMYFCSRCCTWIKNTVHLHLCSTWSPPLEVVWLIESQFFLNGFFGCICTITWQSIVWGGDNSSWILCPHIGLHFSVNPYVYKWSNKCFLLIKF